jgi:hypothetical protein
VVQKIPRFGIFCTSHIRKTGNNIAVASYWWEELHIYETEGNIVAFSYAEKMTKNEK